MQKTYVYDIYIYLQQYISRNCSLFRAGDKSSQRFHNESKTKPNILGKFSCHLGLYAYTNDIISISMDSNIAPKCYLRCI